MRLHGITDLAPVLIVLYSVSIILTSSTFATGGGDFPYENNDIPQDRRPLYLSFIVTPDDSSEQAISRLNITLYESDMKKQIKAVTYAVTLTDLGSGEGILREIFYTEDGSAIILLAHSEEVETRIVNGVQEQFLNAWVADDDGLLISSPHFMGNATYKVTVELLGIDSIRNLLSLQNIPEVVLFFDTGKESRQIAAMPKPELTSFSVDSLSVFDRLQNAIEWSPVHREVMLSATMYNGDIDRQQPFILILEIRDSFGVTQLLSTNAGVLAPNDKQTIELLWTPEIAQSYEMRAFAITDSENPIVLTHATTTNLEAIE